MITIGQLLDSQHRRRMISEAPIPSLGSISPPNMQPAPGQQAVPSYTLTSTIGQSFRIPQRAWEQVKVSINRGQQARVQVADQNGQPVTLDASSGGLFFERDGRLLMKVYIPDLRKIAGKYL